MPITRAKSMLPLVPQEVFDIFLNALICGDLGWPFSSISDSLAGTQWLGIFDPLNLSEFSQLNWELRDIEIDPERIYFRSWSDIVLTSKNFAGQPTLLDSRTSRYLKQKFSRQLEYIRDNGEMSSPIVITMTSDEKIAIFDGTHRVAAKFFLNNASPEVVQAWVGS